MSDGNDIYWDLYELNPDAVIYVEYEDAYVGYTSNSKGFWVAVYDNGAITEAITAGLLAEPEFIDQCIKEIDGKVKESEVQQAIFKLASLEAMKQASLLADSWITGNHTPFMLHLPEIINMEEEADRIFRAENLEE